MNSKKLFATAAFVAVLQTPTMALAETSRVKLGAAFDLGLGVTAQVDKFDLFAGDDGAAIDYRIYSKNLEASVPLTLYISAGGYADWDGDFGARLPVGLELDFAPKWQAFGALIPDLEIHDDTDFDIEAAIGIRYQL